MKLPAPIAKWLDSWGEELSSDLFDAIRVTEEKVLDGRPGRSSRASPFHDKVKLRVGAGCSGVEGPLRALQALGVSFQHVFNFECAAAPRQIIAANSKPEIVLDNVNCQDLPLPRIDFYISGFSCKPFSMLHWKTALLQEAEAKIFLPCWTDSNSAASCLCLGKCGRNSSVPGPDFAHAGRDWLPRFCPNFEPNRHGRACEPPSCLFCWCPERCGQAVQRAAMSLTSVVSN